MEEGLLSERTKELIEHLLENMFISRKDNTELYHLIWKERRQLSLYFQENFKYSLILNQDFIKLEKITTSPKFWMGLSNFKDPRDYTILCCFMAFLEHRVLEEFLLGEVIDSIKNYFPGDTNLTWEGHGGYQNRLSFIRVVEALERLGIIMILDQDIDGFKDNDKQEVLFVKRPESRYYMRSLPFDITDTETIHHIELKMDMERNFSEIGIKEELNRRLFLEPFVRKQDMEDSCYEYLIQNLESIEEMVNNSTNLQLEVYKTGAMLTRAETYSHLKSFPDLRMDSHLVVQLAHHIRTMLVNERLYKDNEGDIYLSRIEFTQIIEEIKENNSLEWSTSYRQYSSNQLCKILLPFLKSWGFCDYDAENDRLVLYDVLGRVSGSYDKQMITQEEEGVEKSS
ncbi:TIGR02678 family protein [Mesobacillus foraminis]|uniref:TIGR02678 family protein n=1 Tax=Mesobacillus foraminis TaxID=279826 RepID=UPI001BE52655|nr:TIGR02678 family protein [Mesobacillus foraminis]MBT2759299.1 TIGR02678 family protein [Mesobacillus foraminis]